MFLHFLCIVLVLWAVWDYLKRRKLIALAKKLPSTTLWALPFVGHAYHFIGNDESRMRIIQRTGLEAVKNEGIAMMWFGRRIMLTVSDPEIADFILKSCLQKGELSKYIREVTGIGSIFADVHIWHPRRKLIAPAFRPKVLKQFMDIFSKQSDIMVQQLQKVSRTGDFEIWKYLVAYSMDAVCQSNLGIEMSVQSSPKEHEFIKCFDIGAKIMAQRLCQPWLQVEFINKKTSYFKTMNYYNKKKQQELETCTKENVKHGAGGETERFKTFLELLIENSGDSEEFTDLELREETLVIAMAGTDTSAVGTGFTILMLAKHPDIQEKVYREIREVLEGSHKILAYEDLSRLEYLDAVIKESLRLYPPVTFITRNVEKEITLPTGDRLIPGVEIMINVWALHRNPKYWGDDAEFFHPERFIGSKLTHPVAFMPFSHGPRNCIGYQYAMMSMKTVIASIVRKYRIMHSTKLSHTGTPDTPFSQFPENDRVKYDIMTKDVNNFTVRRKSNKAVHS